SIEDSTVSASGAIAVTAEADSHLEASVSNTTETAPQRNTKLVGATGISVGAVVTLDKVSSHADAWIDFTSGYSGATTISVGTGVTVTATDHASIASTITLASTAEVHNDNPFTSG